MQGKLLVLIVFLSTPAFGEWHYSEVSNQRFADRLEEILNQETPSRVTGMRDSGGNGVVYYFKDPTCLRHWEVQEYRWAGGERHANVKDALRGKSATVIGFSVNNLHLTYAYPTSGCLQPSEESEE